MIKSVVYLAFLACTCSGVLATEPTRLRVTRTLAANPEVSTGDSIVPTECSINGETFVNVKYLTGDFLKAGSIYARCLPSGQVRCFVDDGDRTIDDAEETSCDAVQPTNDDSLDEPAE